MRKSRGTIESIPEFTAPFKVDSIVMSVRCAVPLIANPGSHGIVLNHSAFRKRKSDGRHKTFKGSDHVGRAFVAQLDSIVAF